MVTADAMFLMHHRIADAQFRQRRDHHVHVRRFFRTSTCTGALVGGVQLCFCDEAQAALAIVPHEATFQRRVTDVHPWLSQRDDVVPSINRLYFNAVAFERFSQSGLPTQTFSQNQGGYVGC